MYSVDIIPQRFVNLVWPHIEPWVIKCDSEYSLTWIKDQLESGHMTAFAVVHGEEIEGVVLLILDKRGEKKVCTVFGIGGINIDKWLDQISRVVNFAKEEQCQAIEFMGRKGWLKMLDPYGFKQTKIVMRQDL